MGRAAGHILHCSLPRTPGWRIIEPLDGPEQIVKRKGNYEINCMTHFFSRASPTVMAQVESGISKEKKLKTTSASHCVERLGFSSSLSLLPPLLLTC